MPASPSSSTLRSFLRMATMRYEFRPTTAFSSSPSPLFASHHHRAFSSRNLVSRRSAPSLSARTSASPLPCPHNRLWLANNAATHSLGALLGCDARPGDALLLTGALGAGKTSLARGFVRAARNDKALDVTSPTYLLVNAYPPARGEAGPTLYHMDLWRLELGTRRRILDFDDVFRRHVSLVEWPDRLGDKVPRERLDVLLEYPERIGDVDEDDPWGFGSGDPDDMGAAREGRFATLLPFGGEWKRRVRRIYKELAVADELGRLFIPDR